MDRAHHFAYTAATVALALSLLTSAEAAPTTQPATQPSTQPAPEVVDEMFNAHGLDQLGEVELIAFTFVVGSGDKETRRAWTWNPQTADVTMTTNDKDGEPEVVAYNRKDEKPGREAVSADRKFINDSFWLMPALHARWAGDSATITDEGQTDLPIGEGKGRKVVLDYHDEGGYTPGDTYVLYLDDELRVTQWSFHRKGAKEGRSIIFSGYETFGPLHIATERKSSADAEARLRFEDVLVMTKSSD